MILVPAVPAHKTPTFDVAANDNTALTSTNVSSANLTYTHPASSSLVKPVALVAIMGIGIITGSPTYADFTNTVTYGGQGMSKIVGAFYLLAGVEWSFTEIYGLTGSPVGPQTVDATINETIATRTSMLAASATYSNVSAFGSSTSATGHSTVDSVTMSSQAGRLLFAAMGGGAGWGGNYSNFNQTQRSYVPNGSGGLLIGDAPGASSVLFQVDSANYEWEDMAVELLP